MKFVITRDQREGLMHEFLQRMGNDQNALTGARYPIVSLYYDNAQRDCYWEKIHGLSNRRKMRVRVYGSMDGAVPPSSFIEVKHKAEGRGVKRRVRLPLERALSIAAGVPFDPACFGPADARVLDEVQKLVREREFRPVCCLRYDREAYVDRDPASDLRVTFDTGIAYRMDDLVPSPDDRNFVHHLLPEGCSVMEVKVTGAVPYWLTRLVGEQHCILQGHSKYCNALEDGDPVLHAQMGGRPSKPHYGITPETFARLRDAASRKGNAQMVTAV